VSRIGRRPIAAVKGVKIERKGDHLKVTGPRGELSADVPHSISFEIGEKQVMVKRASDRKSDRVLHGTWRALLANMMTGVSTGFHPILFTPPSGIKIEVPAPTAVVVSGIDKQLVGQVAAKIRSFRPPEPYKGKGVKYEGEYIRRKAGKAAATAGKAG
jgi:large subunit ribosomal protein L6